MAERSLIVVALGGNAISRPEQEGNVDQQFANAEVTAKALSNLVEAGHRLVITHGNGPQIGNFLLRNLAAAGVIYPLPMEVAVAHVQGGMGYMIAQTLTNELDYRKCNRSVTPIVTTILVDRDDPSFRTPTKPIGRRLNIDDVRRLKREEGWETTEVEPGVFRRVVPSPRPIEILEIETIRRSVDAGDIIVACGGGGIPVIRDPQTGLRGVRAVIDKDYASALLARELKADAMMILTNVDRVNINFGKPEQQGIDHMTVDQAKRWMYEGQFPPGSMGPKMQSAIEFLEHASDTARVIIGPLDRATEAVAGLIGTRITKS